MGRFVGRRGFLKGIAMGKSRSGTVMARAKAMLLRGAHGLLLIPKRLLLFLIWFYQKAISPHFAPCCRFTPTCSAYAKEAILKYGALKGGYLAIRRILKCHPFHPGGYDPVP